MCSQRPAQLHGQFGPELLGLVVFHEELGEGWNRQEPDIYGELIDKIED